MEHHQDTTSNENKVDGEGDERLRSSSASSTSSTSSSEFQDPIQLNSFQKENLPRRNSNEDQDKVEQGTKQPDGDEPTLQSPPIQTMERPDNGSGYRIPSYVFARNKSGAPVEWSTTSNESLFSIHTGNMSFTGDKYSWLFEAGDMYNLPESEESPPTPEIPSSPSSPADSAKVVFASDDPNEAVTHPEKDEVKMNTSESTSDKPSTGEDQTIVVPSRSNESFAFPVMENEDRGGGSVPEKAEEQKKAPSESSEEETSSPEAANPSACNWFGSCLACFSCRAKTDKGAAATSSKD